jgi:preprotein translocase subunit YajC
MLGITELAATPAKSSGFNPSSLILILVVVVAFYLLMIRPQQRRRQQAAQKQHTIQPGARVRTTAGMYATVVDVDGDDVILEVAPGIEVRYMKRAVMDVVAPAEAEDAPDGEADAEYFDAQAAEHADDVDDTAEADDARPAAAAANGPAATANGSAAANGSAPQADSEENAYEQATGTKQD